RDLYTPLAAGQVVEGVDISSPDGLSILLHSAAHVLAQAVQKTNPDAKLGIGPPITDGFYYDFDVAEPFTPESLKALEKEMNRIVKSGQRFVRRELSDDAARAEEASEPYKLELIGLHSHSAWASELANLHTDAGRDYFMQRYHDVISSVGSNPSYGADNRPFHVMRSRLWASGYDVDGTDQT